jgi:hypothetical protein
MTVAVVYFKELFRHSDGIPGDKHDNFSMNSLSSSGDSSKGPERCQP